MPWRVVIVGAGFGGLAAMRRLARKDARGGVEVTVVDRTNHHLFSPLLYQVATAGLNPQDIAYSVRGIARHHANVRVRLGEVARVDLPARRVLLADGSVLDYDRLVLAAGAVTADFGVPGVAEHAFPLKELGHAAGLRNHLLCQFERAVADPAAVDAGALTFVIVGGGPTGVELAGALSELVTKVLRGDFPELDVARARIVLAEATPTLLGPFTERLQRYAVRRLERMGVEVRLAEAISAVTPDGVRFADGSELPASTVVWAAGVKANPLGGALGVELGRGGRVPVDAALRLAGHPEVFVIGDLAAAPAAAGGPHPQLAPVATQQGRHVAEVITAEAAGRTPAPFRYRDKGIMATIGRNAAVVELFGRLRFGGPLAWIAWLWLHLVLLIGFRNRASVMLNWAWSYLTYDRGLRAVFDPALPWEDDRPGVAAVPARRR
jgi:NADH:ubiquinone reductase (H+-translocating)